MKLFFAFVFLNTASLFAQYLNYPLPKNQALDSIASTRKTLKYLNSFKGRDVDSIRIERLNFMARLYREISKDSSLRYSQIAIKKSLDFKQRDLLAVSYYTIGCSYEYYKQWELAEKNLLLWYQIRKSATVDNHYETRWALAKLREHYSRRKEIKKLELVDKEWVDLVAVDYYDKKKDSLTKYQYYWQSPESQCFALMNPVIQNLVSINEFFTAEKYFIQLITEFHIRYEGWLHAEMPYFQAEQILVQRGDTAALSTWYQHWFSAMDSIYPYPHITISTLEILSQQYIGKNKKLPAHAQQYYQLILQKATSDFSPKTVFSIYEKQYMNAIKLNLEYFEKIRLLLKMFEILSSINDPNATDLLLKLDKEMQASTFYNKEENKRLQTLIEEIARNTKNQRFVIWKESHEISR